MTKITTGKEKEIEIMNNSLPFSESKCREAVFFLRQRDCQSNQAGISELGQLCKFHQSEPVVGCARRALQSCTGWISQRSGHGIRDFSICWQVALDH